MEEIGERHNDCDANEPWLKNVGYRLSPGCGGECRQSGDRTLSDAPERAVDLIEGSDGLFQREPVNGFRNQEGYDRDQQRCGGGAEIEDRPPVVIDQQLFHH